MLVAHIETWVHGNRDDCRPVCEVRISNISLGQHVADYEVRDGADGRVAIVRSHRRGDGALVLVHKAVGALLSEYYASPFAQMPPSVVRLLPERPYRSRACQSAQDVADCVDPKLSMELHVLGFPTQGEYAQVLHKLCRLDDKLTKSPCVCQCHEAKENQEAA